MSSKLAHGFTALLNLELHVHALNRPCPARPDVLELDDKGNAVNAATAAPSLMTLVFSISSMQFPSNPFWMDVGNRTSS